jgi:hypothetical protein
METKSKHEIYLCLIYTLYAQPEGNFMQYFYCTFVLTMTPHVRSVVEVSMFLNIFISVCLLSKGLHCDSSVHALMHV